MVIQFVSSSIIVFRIYVKYVYFYLKAELSQVRNLLILKINYETLKCNDVITYINLLIKYYV